MASDITDSKTEEPQGSGQILEEWRQYYEIISELKLANITKILDIRGNHGRVNSQSYMYIHQKPFGKYSFIGIDACINPGLKRPLNNFGVLNVQTIKLLHLFSQRSMGSNHTFWFGHYPTSTIVSQGFDLRSLIGSLL
ncbi:unnamed protein product [Protopolystoma xenopodis]|uniref:Calcineurin-like phosphoesterase domain-containing protein n=1 Tax=Protopolystoma xenopodis TaxID=117903 RepID=A0A448XEL1_9PLAT|nr:unnamed protein product [Protopolystoma xenopodis]